MISFSFQRASVVTTTATTTIEAMNARLAVSDMKLVSVFPPAQGLILEPAVRNGLPACPVEALAS